MNDIVDEILSTIEFELDYNIRTANNFEISKDFKVATLRIGSKDLRKLVKRLRNIL